MPLFDGSVDPQIKEFMNPGACYSATAIRAFLRYSRKRSDDNLHNTLPRTGSCADHITKELFPAWYSRDVLIEYCSKVAEVKKEQLEMKSSEEVVGKRIDPRLDPYGARDFDRVPPAAEESIRTWVQAERNVETIVRQNSADLLAEKCGSFSAEAQSYLDAYENRFH
ncbi:hypothetical protein TRVA0_002S02520 [Trichomonascus vanleenenianus]|uniref:Mix23p n=1 Tax=Trichomonascus vanleenenianus TaxID=2268995 RepID=UPI003ECA7871